MKQKKNDNPDFAVLEEIENDLKIISDVINRLQDQLKSTNMPDGKRYEKEKELIIYLDMVRDLCFRKKFLISKIKEDKT